jgi:hypothetical protein
MTKMISKVDAQYWAEHEDTDDVTECLISNDKLELIEMFVDRVKTMEVGESVMMNLVPDADKEDIEWMVKSELNGTNCFEKSEVVYTTGE